MKIMWNDAKITGYVTSVTWAGSAKQAARTVVFSVAYSPNDKNVKTLGIKLGDKIVFYPGYPDDKKTKFVGIITQRERKSEMGELQYTATDGMMHLLRSSGTYRFANKTPEKIAQMVCRDVKVKTGSIAKTKMPIAKIFFQERPYYEIIMAAYTKAYRKNKKKYIAQMNGDKLEVIQKGKVIPNFHIRQGERITESSYTEDLDSMVNRVYIYDSNNNKIGSVSNSNWIKKYGIFQNAISVDSGNGKTEAKAELQGINKTANLTMIGDCRYRPYRGSLGARDWSHIYSHGYRYDIGWRPALRVLNAAPQITPASKSYGELNKPINIDYAINDSDGDKFNISVKIDGTQKESYQSQSNGTFSLVLSKYWSALSIGSHTVAITATDTKNAATTVTYTFTKKNGPADAPTIISPANGERRDSDFYVEFNIGADSEGDTQTFKVQMSGNSGFSNSKEFTSLEKYVGGQWVSAASASNEDVGTKFRIKVTGASGEVYLRVVSTDSGILSEARAIRIGTILDMQTHPQETADRAQKMVVLLDLVADDKVTKEIWVANNANDASPAWETYTPDSAGNHTFQNTAKVAEKWAVAARVKITANDSTGEIALRAIGMGVL